jgi:hypothetical protein
MAETTNAASFPCVVEGCTNPATQSVVAKGRYLQFTTNYCPACYQRLRYHGELSVDKSLIIVERVR